MNMKKSLLFIIASFGIISCNQDDDSFPNREPENGYKSSYFYERGEAAQDSLTVSFPQYEEDGDPPLKDMDDNGGRPGSGNYIRTD